MTGLRERVKRVWEVLGDDPRGKSVGSQAWFARQVDRLTGWKVSEATVHRWLYKKTPIDVRCFETLNELEDEATVALTAQRDDMAATVTRWTKQIQSGKDKPHAR